MPGIRTSKLLAPDFMRDLDAKGQFGFLLGLAHLVAVVGAGKAALGADAKLVDIHISGCVFDPGLEVILGLQFGKLGSHPGREPPSCPWAQNGAARSRLPGRCRIP